MVRSLTWALECDRPQRRRSVLLQVLEVDLEEGRRFEAVHTSILWRGRFQRSGQQAGSLLIRNSVYKTANKISTTRKTIGCFTETVACLYQQTISKTEFKELEIESLHTDVYTGSLQIQSYIQSSQNPEEIHLAITTWTPQEPHSPWPTHQHQDCWSGSPQEHTANLSKHRNETYFSEYKDYTCYRR